MKYNVIINNKDGSRKIYLSTKSSNKAHKTAQLLITNFKVDAFVEVE